MLKYTTKAVRKKAMEQKANQKVKERIYKRRKDIKIKKIIFFRHIYRFTKTDKAV